MVEQLIRNQQVVGSSPIFSFLFCHIIFAKFKNAFKYYFIDFVEICQVNNCKLFMYILHKSYYFPDKPCPDVSFSCNYSIIVI